VALLRGSNSIYKRTKDIFPAESQGRSSESLRLEATFRSQAGHSRVSLNKLKQSNFAKYKDTTVGFVGQGQVFGDIDVVKKQNYMYSLRVAKANSSLFLIKASSFLQVIGQYGDTFEKLSKACEENDIRLLKQLTTVVFNKWYGNVTQEHQRV